MHENKELAVTKQETRDVFVEDYEIPASPSFVTSRSTYGLMAKGSQPLAEEDVIEEE